MTRERGPKSYLKVQLRVPDSFPLEGVGIGGEKKASMITPLWLSLGLSAPLLDHSRTDKHWLPDMTLVFFKCRSKSFSLFRHNEIGEVELTRIRR